MALHIIRITSFINSGIKEDTIFVTARAAERQFYRVLQKRIWNSYTINAHRQKREDSLGELLLITKLKKREVIREKFYRYFL